MKKFVTLGLIAMLAFATTAVVPSVASAKPAPAAPQGAGLVSSILNKMERNRRELKSLRAGVWMQKYNAQIKDEDNFVGDAYYIPGAGRNVSLRVDWRKPQQETLIVEGGEYTLFKPRMNMAYKGSTSSASKNNKVTNVIGFGLNVSKAELNAKFQPVELLGEGTLEDGGAHVWWLKLVPKGNAGYQHAEIWVDDNGMPCQVRIVERNNDMTTVRLLNPQRNAPVAAGTFSIDLGSGVKIVKG
jgi:outer membrane lipoprotein-sorting protein